MDATWDRVHTGARADRKVGTRLEFDETESDGIRVITRVTERTLRGLRGGKTKTFCFQTVELDSIGCGCRI